MSVGILENIAEQLVKLNNNLEASNGQNGADATVKSAETPEDKAPDTTVTGGATKKKAAAKKTAAKRAPAKKKGDDLSNMTLFKKRLFEVAEASGSDNVLPELKKFIKKCGYAGSDEIDVDERADFLMKVREHFSPADALDESDDESEDEIDI